MLQLAPGGLDVVARLEDGSIVTTLGETILGGGATYVAGAMTMTLAVVAGGGVVSLTPGHAPPPVASGAVAVGATAVGASCVLDAAGAVTCWGTLAGCDPRPEQSYWCRWSDAPGGGQAVQLGQRAVALSTGGDQHVCALLADGGVRCWGGAGVCPTYGRCSAPAAQDATLGGSVDIATNADGARVYAGWHAIDLGARP